MTWLREFTETQRALMAERDELVKRYNRNLEKIANDHPHVERRAMFYHTCQRQRV